VSLIKRIALSVLGGLLVLSLSASPSSPAPVWNLANPSQLAAYQVGNGVITIASLNVLTCERLGLFKEAHAFVYDFKVASPGKGILCLANYAGQFTAFYETGSPSTVTVNTKSGTKTVNVQAPPPQQQTIGHLPFH
jgi:hypothetical protein